MKMRSRRPTSFQFTPLREGRPASKGARFFFAKNFNSRPSARGDAAMIATLSPKKFQFTPLREGRHGFNSVLVRRTDFNSRPSARGDQKLLRILGIETEFQFTPLREGRQKFNNIELLSVIFQFTPLREGRRGYARRIISAVISIHAPPRGATGRAKK